MHQPRTMTMTMLKKRLPLVGVSSFLPQIPQISECLNYNPNIGTMKEVSRQAFNKLLKATGPLR